LFLTHGNFNITERIATAPRPDKGVGKLNLECCWCVDKVLELGERMGIYHMLTLTNQTNFRGNNGGWDANVYNVKNGGFLERPADYFTDERALRTFEHILRYAVARWGYSTAVFSWDFWNEVNSPRAGSHCATCRTGRGSSSGWIRFTPGSSVAKPQRRAAASCSFKLP